MSLLYFLPLFYGKLLSHALEYRKGHETRLIRLIRINFKHIVMFLSYLYFDLRFIRVLFIQWLESYLILSFFFVIAV